MMEGFDVPNAAEIIEKLARESERQKIEIAGLKERIAQLEAELAKVGKA